MWTIIFYGLIFIFLVVCFWWICKWAYAADIAQRSKERQSRCDGCDQMIDPDCCWCGDPMDGHGQWASHAKIPMGCRCGRVTS